MEFTSLRNKKILITGNTGFKGSWLSLILLKYGAKVYGISNAIPTYPSLYKISGLTEEVHQEIADLRQIDTISKIASIAPDIIFHMAAQPLVKEAIRNPYFTIENNILSTLTILEYLRKPGVKCIALFITSDKCYLNRNSASPFTENDILGGTEPYGASKAACEILYASYYHTYFKHLPHIRSGTARAGNVIGGGDFSMDRIIPDCITAWQNKKPVSIRKKNAVRPWQHVLEPLGGYLQLCCSLMESTMPNGESLNFGPSENAFFTVSEVVMELATLMKIPLPEPVLLYAEENGSHEAEILKISSEKAHKYIGWKPQLNFHQSIELVAQWYNCFINDQANIRRVTDEQISAFFENMGCV